METMDPPPLDSAPASTGHTAPGVPASTPPDAAPTAPAPDAAQPAASTPTTTTPTTTTPTTPPVEKTTAQKLAGAVGRDGNKGAFAQARSGELFNAVQNNNSVHNLINADHISGVRKAGGGAADIVVNNLSLNEAKSAAYKEMSFVQKRLAEFGGNTGKNAGKIRKGVAYLGAAGTAVGAVATFNGLGKMTGILAPSKDAEGKDIPFNLVTDVVLPTAGTALALTAALKGGANRAMSIGK